MDSQSNNKSSRDNASHDRQKAKDVRLSNISASKAVADAVRTSLGPRGLDKMVQEEGGDVFISNDGATILSKMRVEHPAAKMLVDLSKAQDVEAGDGTTTVVVIAGSLLSACLTLLGKGIHPSVISDAFQFAVEKAEEILERAAQPVDVNDRAAVVQAAATALSSKVVSQHAALLAPIAVEAVTRISNLDQPDSIDLRNIRVVKKLGGTLDDTELFDGLVLNQHANKSAGGVTKVTGAKVALIQFCLSAPKTDIENNVIVQDYSAMDRVLREERQYILNLCKKIKNTGCNVLLIQKSILRDATSELSLHYLAKMKIMVVQDIEREEIEFIAKSLQCVPIAGIDSFVPEKLAKVDLVEEVTVGTEKMVKLSGIQGKHKTVSIIARGSNKLMLDETERSLHDAFCVVRSLFRRRFLIAGGGAAETEVAVGLNKIAKTLEGAAAFCVRAFADALEVIPYTLAENAGLPSIEIVTELRNKHVQGDKNAGINFKKGCISNMAEENVVMPLLVTVSALRLATECVRMILKIDDIVMTR
ncbi:hypothetical protein GAYE_SCF03G2258 [Galdieria yellowstonensis]|uniref:T-complex protein 1 subunit delta n=1 Tax=Galdieria yellowstonensis TaxID=3028027 RepID=A0AAV9IAI7_9RHOD|nr:hypothetical protein GAYE_SCF03G2258 [Galdieria yellowstonensis]